MSINLAAVLRNAGLDEDQAAEPTPETTAIGAIRTHLLALAAAERRDPALVKALTTTFLNGCHGLTNAQMKVMLSMLADDAERQAGRVPAGDTAGIRCRHCGPIYAPPGVAAVLPVVGGWPTAIGCPWCFIHGVSVPRPTEPWRP